MKTISKSKAVIAFFITICILGRGNYAVLAKSSTINKENCSKSYVVVCGVPVGIKLKSHGVIITGFMGFCTNNNEYISPAKEAGIKEGDRIVGINGISVEGIDDMQKALDGCGETEINVEIENGNGKCIKKVRLCRDSETDELKMGIWGRDNVSGIGTLTFYDEKTGKYGALGHAISDGVEPYCISGGSLMTVEITGIKKGVAGVPGEIRGYFKENAQVVGNVNNNCNAGIFGHLDNPACLNNSNEFCKVRVARNFEIHKGNAYILTSVIDGTVQKYDIEITQINKENDDGTKSYNIKVTDNKLLEITGGIVQGMSGSPIIQDGKLVGAVTHVLVNDPSRGYGIFIENMLNAAHMPMARAS